MRDFGLWIILGQLSCWTVGDFAWHGVFDGGINYFILFSFLLFYVFFGLSFI